VYFLGGAANGSAAMVTAELQASHNASSVQIFASCWHRIDLAAEIEFAEVFSFDQDQIDDDATVGASTQDFCLEILGDQSQTL